MYGIASEEATTATSDVNTLNASLDKLPKSKQIQIDLLVSGTDRLHFARHWKGSAYIPYDGYPALLDRGEKILTATEARNEEASGMSTREVVGAISGLRNDLQQLQLVVNGKNFGRAVVDYGGNRVDNYLGSSESRFESGYGT